MFIVTTSLFCVLLGVMGAIRSRHALQHKLEDAWIGAQMRFLHSTRVTIDHQQFGHIIPVNDDLLLIRHTSGRLVYLPTHSPSHEHLGLPDVIAAWILMFFSL